MSQSQELFERRRFSEKMNSRVLFRTFPVHVRVRGCQDHHRRLAAAFAPSQVSENFFPVPLREVQVQQKEVRTPAFRIEVQSGDKRKYFFAVPDNAKVARYVMFAQSVTYQPNIRRIIFSQNNVAWRGRIIHIGFCLLAS